MKSDENNIIPEIPDIPIEIKDAINNNKLAIFIGAGVSRLVGCKGWRTLAQNLLKLCFDKNYLNFAEYDALLKDSDNKKMISIAHSLLKTNNETEFYEQLQEALTPCTNKTEIQTIFENIYYLGTTFVTTNADECFDSMFESAGNSVYDFTATDVLPENRKLYHIHGSIKNKESLVFTTSQYLKQYKNTRFQKFLENLFEKYTVLFIGYGLSEFELLDFLILKADNSYFKKQPKHFALMPYFSYETAIAGHYSLYFQELNIKTVPYAKDKKGYAQLIDIFNNWASQIRENTFYFTNKIEELKIIVESSKTDENTSNKIIQLIENDSTVFEEFIKLCRTHWNITNYMIKPLYELGYFNPDKNPKTEKIEEEPGYYKVPTWSIMDFLESYLKYVKSTGDKTQFNLYKDIIFLNIQNTENNHIDNYHTDNSLVEFIFNLDESDINDKCINFIDIALHSKWDTLVVSSTIAEKILPRILNFTDVQKIKKILLVIFSFEPKNSCSIKSLVDTYYLGIIFERYFLRLYEKLQSDFIDVFDEIVSNLKNENLIFMSIESKKYDYPQVDSSDYAQTLINCYVWFASQQDNQSKFLQQTRKKITNNRFIDIVEKNINLNVDATDFPCSTIDDSMDLPSDSSNDILNSINTLSEIKSMENFSIKIHNIILQSPDMLINDLDKFTGVPFAYINQIISAYLSLLREQKFFDINNVISFMSNIIERQELWEGKENRRTYNYELWTVHNICELISFVCANLSDSISQDCYELFKCIAIKIYQNLEKDEQDDNEMYSMMHMLNSESGKCFEALIQLYLFSVQHFNKKYDDEIRNIFLNELYNKKHPIIYTALGAYFSVFYYKDKIFAESIYSKIFDIEDNKLKKSVLDGYLYGSYTSMTKKYYLYLKKKNFFVNLIDYVAEDEKWCSFISKIACAFYMVGLDDFKDEKSLIYKVVATNNVLYIRPIVQYFFGLKRGSDKEWQETKENKIVSIWTRICENLEQYKDRPLYNDCIVELLKFITSINLIEKTVSQNIEFSIRWIPKYSIEYYLLDNFKRLYSYQQQNEDYIIKILEKFADKKVFFYDYKEKLTHLFREIHNKYPEKAIKLCNIYIRKGNESKFLKLLEEFKNTKKNGNDT